MNARIIQAGVTVLEGKNPFRNHDVSALYVVRIALEVV